MGQTWTVVTGSNTGIGRVTALELARAGHRLILACRSESKTIPVLEEIRTLGGEAAFLSLDLANLDKVAQAARSLHDRDEAIGLLINNAGLAGSRGLTEQGFELTFGVNHLGTFTFTQLLLPLLKKAERARVVTVASRAHYKAKGIDWSALQKPTATLTGLREYERSKLCNVLFAKELARREPWLRSFSLHPGVVASDIWRQIPWPVRPIALKFMITNEEGAKTSLHCATSPEVETQSGEYFDECKPKKPSQWALDADLAKTLWQRSEEFAARWLPKN